MDFAEWRKLKPKCLQGGKPTKSTPIWAMEPLGTSGIRGNSIWWAGDMEWSWKQENFLKVYLGAVRPSGPLHHFTEPRHSYALAGYFPWERAGTVLSTLRTLLKNYTLRGQMCKTEHTCHSVSPRNLSKMKEAGRCFSGDTNHWDETLASGHQALWMVEKCQTTDEG